jgi:hypothetical protein
MNIPSHTCDHGPCPRSWHSPAICTHSTSRSVMPSAGCRVCRCVAISRARCATPAGAPSAAGGIGWSGEGRTEAVLEAVVGRAGPDVVARAELLDLLEPLEVLAVLRSARLASPPYARTTHVSMISHTRCEMGTARSRQPHARGGRKDGARAVAVDVVPEAARRELGVVERRVERVVVDVHARYLHARCEQRRGLVRAGPGSPPSGPASKTPRRSAAVTTPRFSCNSE